MLVKSSLLRGKGCVECSAWPHIKNISRNLLLSESDVQEKVRTQPTSKQFRWRLKTLWLRPHALQFNWLVFPNPTYFNKIHRRTFKSRNIHFHMFFCLKNKFPIPFSFPLMCSAGGFSTEPPSTIITLAGFLRSQASFPLIYPFLSFPFQADFVKHLKRGRCSSKN